MSIYEDRFDRILTNIERVRLRVNQHQIIKIIAISKNTNKDEIKNMYAIGHRAFGENRVQEYKEKAVALEELPLEWHFVGRLQTNKINALIDLNPYLMQSCSSLEMALEIDKRLMKKNKNMSILLQVNSAYDEQKAGVLPEDAIRIYEKIIATCPNIKLKGVMSIGAFSKDKKIVEKSFKITHSIF